MDLEGVWTYEQSEAFAIRILRQALQMLKQDPQFAFTQDQMQALKPFWDGLSQADRDFLRRMISEGRFEVATGMFVQPDVNEPDFESLSRQFLIAKPWMEQALGAKILTAWNIDTFGQTVQMPQLYRQAGLKYCFFSRDVPPALKDSALNLFWWRSPDGSQVLAHRAIYSTGLERGVVPFLGVNPEPAALESLRDLIAHNPAGNDLIMLPWGADEWLQTQTSRQIEARVRQAAAQLHIPINRVVVSTASEYFQAVERRGVSLPTYTYDFNPPLVLQDLRGVWGERPSQKLAERRAEDMLESSEKLASIVSLYGEPYPERDFSWAWRRLLANQVHDTMAGSNADPVYALAMSRYAGAIEAGRQIEEDALYQLSRRIDTARSDAFPIVVFNTLSFPRTEVVHLTRTFFQEMFLTNRQVSNFRILDPQGRVIPFRVVDASRWADTLTMAEIEFVATDMPAMGYRVYRIEPIQGSLQVPAWQPLKGDVTTRVFILKVDPATGSIVELADRRTGADLLAHTRYGANELVLEAEKDPDMEGAIHLTGAEIRSSQFKPDSIKKFSDGLGTTVRIEAPFMDGRRIQEIRLYDQLARIDFRTELKAFPGQDGLLTVVFPLPRGSNPESAYETHNAVTERPGGIYAAQTWVDVGTAQQGVAVLNHGTGGYQIEGENARLILLRSLTHYGQYLTPQASEAGEHVFDYSLYPHPGDWSTSGVIEQAHSLNSPLRVISTDAHDGPLSTEHSFLSVLGGHFEITALKKAENSDDFILRGHETNGKPGRVTLHLELPLERAWTADLLEQPGKQIDVHQGDVEFSCQPFEFVTLRLKGKRVSR